MDISHRALSGNFHFTNPPPQAPDDEASMAVIFPVDWPPARERFDQWQDVVSSTYGLVASRHLDDRSLAQPVLAAVAGRAAQRIPARRAVHRVRLDLRRH